MPEYLSPGVYVEEVSGGIKPIEGVGTSTGGFIGIAEKGPIVGAVYEDDLRGQPVFISNPSDFARNFGGFIQGEFLAYAVQQFFQEGGTRCYVARTAHFGNPSDHNTLTAKRANRPLGGIATTITGGLAAGATSATLANATGLQTGMQLFLTDGTQGGRVSITGVGPGNQVQFVNTVVDALGNPVALPAFSGTVAVTQVVLDVNAINEGTWGNRLRVNVSPSGRIGTTLDMPGDFTANPVVP